MRTNIGRGILIQADNMSVLAGMKSESIDLIYLDPPFNSGRKFRDFDDVWGTLEREVVIEHDAAQSLLQIVRQGCDASIFNYLMFMTPRLLAVHRILKATGSLYVHCDTKAHSYLRILLDLIFGSSMFRNEIVWKRTTAHNDSRRYGKIGDRILYYTKSDDFTFNLVYGEYSAEQMRRYKHSDENGLYRAETLVAYGNNPSRKVPWRGAVLGEEHQWRFSIEQLEEYYAEGRILLRKDGVPRKDGFKAYLSESAGPRLQDIWLDCRLGPTSGERKFKYSTQKPEVLMERILAVSSNMGDVVVDPFCGSGTLCTVAERMGRRWIGIDESEHAVQLAESRVRQEISCRGGLVV